MKYVEILKLATYCADKGIDCTLEPLFDGWAIRFPNGHDFAQHNGTFKADQGFVEPNIDCGKDFEPVTLKEAKALVDENLVKKTYKFKVGGYYEARYKGDHTLYELYEVTSRTEDSVVLRSVWDGDTFRRFILPYTKGQDETVFPNGDIVLKASRRVANH